MSITAVSAASAAYIQQSPSAAANVQQPLTTGQAGTQTQAAATTQVFTAQQAAAAQQSGQVAHHHDHHGGGGEAATQPADITQSGTNTTSSLLNALV